MELPCEFACVEGCMICCIIIVHRWISISSNSRAARSSTGSMRFRTGHNIMTRLSFVLSKRVRRSCCTTRPAQRHRCRKTRYPEPRFGRALACAFRSLVRKHAVACAFSNAIPPYRALPSPSDPCCSGPCSDHNLSGTVSAPLSGPEATASHKRSPHPPLSELCSSPQSQTLERSSRPSK